MAWFTTDWSSSHHTVRCAHKSHKSRDVINFIVVAYRISSRLKWYKNYKNRLRLAKVVVKNKMSRFLWFSVYTTLGGWRLLIKTYTRRSHKGAQQNRTLGQHETSRLSFDATLSTTVTKLPFTSLLTSKLFVFNFVPVIHFTLITCYMW